MRRFYDAIAIGMAASVALIWADRVAACTLPDPSVNIYAVACSSTSNLESQQSLFIDSNGVVQSGTQQGAGPFTTAPAQFQNAGVPHDNVNATQTESIAAPHAGSVFAAAGVGDTFSTNYTQIQLINGNQVLTQQHLAEKAVIPNLHAVATGTFTATTALGFGGTSAGSGAVGYFSDIISIGQAQVDYVNQLAGQSSNSVQVELPYRLKGTANGQVVSSDGSFSDLSGSFIFSATPLDSGTCGGIANVGGSDGSSFSAQVSYTVDHTYSLILSMCPDQRYLVTVQLSVEGGGTSMPGSTVDYKGDFGNTAEFLGAHFFADEAGTDELPTLDLNSRYGFTYAPVTIVADNGSSNDVPEPASLALLGVGLSALGFAKRGRRRGHAARSACVHGL